AHSLEHLGKEDIEKAKKLGKNAVPINDFKEGGSGVIALLEVEDPRILSRLIGIGLTIGAKFTVLKIRNKELILSVNGRPVIIDRDLGKYILGARR
ncbi:MAG: hypothetical protein GWP10_07965, partial [Nitrospiraceae bacterium]|nr:hypothetical protein [Nitrospiraceae bacterium]